MKIIVTGSLGHIGKPLTEELLQNGHAVTVISSNAKKQKEIQGIGAAAAIGMLDDVDFLTKTFSGSDALFCMIPPNYFSEDQQAYYRKIGNSYAKAITQANVKRVVHLSSYGAHLEKGTGFIVGSHIVENILNNLEGLAVTHVRPGYFYYNLLNFAAMVKATGFIGANYGGEDMLVLAAPSEIAKAAAEELTASGAGINVCYVASDERSCNEIARVLGDAIGKPDLKWLTLTTEQMKAGLESNGVPPHIAANLAELGGAIHSGILREDYDKHKPAQGEIKIEDFAKEFAAAYAKN